MTENFESERAVNGDLDQAREEVRRAAAVELRDTLRLTAIEWYDWDVTAEVVVADDYTMDIVYPPEQLIEGRRKMQASVLNGFIQANFRRMGMVVLR